MPKSAKSLSPSLSLTLALSVSLSLLRQRPRLSVRLRLRLRLRPRLSVSVYASESPVLPIGLVLSMIPTTDPRPEAWSVVGGVLEKAKYNQNYEG